MAPAVAALFLLSATPLGAISDTVARAVGKSPAAKLKSCAHALRDTVACIKQVEADDAAGRISAPAEATQRLCSCARAPGDLRLCFASSYPILLNGLCGGDPGEGCNRAGPFPRVYRAVGLVKVVNTTTSKREVRAPPQHRPPPPSSCAH